MVTRRAVLLAAGAACAGIRPTVGHAKNVVLTAADVHVDGYPTVEAVRWMGRMLARKTDGRLDVRVYHSGQLGRETDTVNLARFGVLDITRVNMAALNNAFPSTRILSLPYVFDSTEHMRRALDGDVGREILTHFDARGLVGLAFYDSGARCFYNVRHPVAAPADLHGLKLRVPPSDIFIALVRALGANPTPLSYGEVYSSLQTHLIDGAENNWRTFHSSRQFEVAKHWAQSEHSYSPEALLMSRRRFDAFSAEDQALIRAAATQSVPYMRELWDRAEAESRAAVIAAGVQVTEVDRAAFHRAAEPVLASYLKDPELQRLYAGIRALA
ncbi:MAG TPA: TRAP transporter substrate-binding protein [Steroidobacteraceae bacterium]|nr:TRAP transporter substrate-binding protein [Steroidobacteraceae bacterium]